MSRMTRISTIAMVVGLSATALQAQDATSVEVLHWWTAGNEAKAAAVLADALNEAGGEWVDGAQANGDLVYSTGINRIIGGNPPGAMQYAMGSEYQELINAGRLANLDAVAEAGGWAEIYPTAVMDGITFDGHIYAMPVALSTISMMWGSQAALDKVGASLPTSWDEFFETADKLQAEGMVPFAQSGNIPYWYFATWASILGTMGSEAYYDFFSLDEQAMSSEAVVQAAEILGRLRSYSDTGAQGRTWDQSTNMIISGDAGFEFMGGWATGPMISAGLEPGTDITCSFIGGEESQMVLAGDVFVLPLARDAEGLTEGQSLLAEVSATADVSRDFALANGSIPIRNDVDPAPFSACTKVAAGMLANDQSVMPPNILISNDVMGGFGDAISVFWVTPNMTPEDLLEEFKIVAQDAL